MTYNQLNIFDVLFQDSFYPREDYALVVTKSVCFEGPFYLNRREQIVGFHDSILGEKDGIRYSLVSGDDLKWKPMKALG